MNDKYGTMDDALKQVYSPENMARWDAEWLEDFKDLEWHGRMDTKPTKAQLLAYWERKQELLKAKADKAYRIYDLAESLRLSAARHEIWSCIEELKGMAP